MNTASSAPKRVSTGSSASNDVEAHDEYTAPQTTNYDKMSATELKHRLRERGKSFSNFKKAELAQRLRDDDNSTALAGPPDELKWVTRCRTLDDIRAEKEAGEGVDDEEDEGADEDDEDDDEHGYPINRCEDGCMCQKPLQEHPEWKWSISNQALDIMQQLMKECWMRDHDAQGQYHYNDFNGYGVQEVVENAVGVLKYAARPILMKRRFLKSTRI